MNFFFFNISGLNSKRQAIKPVQHGSKFRSLGSASHALYCNQRCGYHWRSTFKVWKAFNFSSHLLWSFKLLRIILEWKMALILCNFAFLCIKSSGKKKKTILFTISSKRIKHLKINLPSRWKIYILKTVTLMSKVNKT